MIAASCCVSICQGPRLSAHARARALQALRSAAERARGLADPTRLSLAAALAEADELCVCDLAWIAGRSQNLISHHLRALRAIGLVDARRSGKMVMYSLTSEGRALLSVVLPAGAHA